MKQLLELPLNLTIVSPAHTPNWDLVSDVVNSCSRIYRSPKQCRNRYENVIIPREEGKVTNSHSVFLKNWLALPDTCLNHVFNSSQLVYEANPKKKTKSIYKVLYPDHFISLIFFHSCNSNLTFVVFLCIVFPFVCTYSV